MNNSGNLNWMGNRVFDPNGARNAVSTDAGTQSPAQTPVIPAPQPVQEPDMLAEPPAAQEGYVPYFLAQNMGKSVRAEFIIGNNQYVDKTGIISEVGVSYFVLTDTGSRTRIMCDLYSVKFVTVLD